MNDRISIEVDAGVADVRLRRGDKMNALDPAMFAALIGACDELAASPGLRAVVLSGDGRAFCAGLDMASFAAMEHGEERAPRDLRQRTHGLSNDPQFAVMGWRELAVPVIAAVHGVAFGGGFQLALGADMRFVAPDTRFSIMESKWGLVPDMGGMLLMPQMARDDIIRELTYTGRIFGADEALAYGFATRVCADPRAEALAVARDIAGKSPDATRAAKRLFNAAGASGAAEILLAESDAQARLIGALNQREAVAANLGKRLPRFVDPA